MRLKESTRTPISSVALTVIRKFRAPAATAWVPSASFWMGTVIPLAIWNPNHVPERMITSAMPTTSEMYCALMGSL